jgi:hypothetical protein
MKSYPLYITWREWHHCYLGSGLKLLGWVTVFLGHFWSGILIYQIKTLKKGEHAIPLTVKTISPLA